MHLARCLWVCNLRSFLYTDVKKFSELSDVGKMQISVMLTLTCLSDIGQMKHQCYESSDISGLSFSCEAPETSKFVFAF